jgi:hypothetical protein
MAADIVAPPFSMCSLAGSWLGDVGGFVRRRVVISSLPIG